MQPQYKAHADSIWQWGSKGVGSLLCMLVLEAELMTGWQCFKRLLWLMLPAGHAHKAHQTGSPSLAVMVLLMSVRSLACTTSCKVSK